jgi:hypothetical protein
VVDVLAALAQLGQPLQQALALPATLAFAVVLEVARQRRESARPPSKDARSPETIFEEDFADG